MKAEGTFPFQQSDELFLGLKWETLLDVNPCHFTQIGFALESKVIYLPTMTLVMYMLHIICMAFKVTM